VPARTRSDSYGAGSCASGDGMGDDARNRAPARRRGNGFGSRAVPGICGRDRPPQSVKLTHYRTVNKNPDRHDAARRQRRFGSNATSRTPPANMWCTSPLIVHLADVHLTEHQAGVTSGSMIGRVKCGGSPDNEPSLGGATGARHPSGFAAEKGVTLGRASRTFRRGEGCVGSAPSGATTFV
jgi:hypothetical protein